MESDDRFTGREKEVVNLLLEGKSNKQIAFLLGISKSTVEFHLKNIYSKLGVTSRAEAILSLSKNHLWNSTDQEEKENLWQSIGEKSVQQAYSSQAKHFFDPKEEKAMQNRTMISVILSVVAILAVGGMLAYVKLDENARIGPLTPSTEQPISTGSPEVVLQVPPGASTRSYDEVLLFLRTPNVPFHYAIEFVGTSCFIPEEKISCAFSGPIPISDDRPISGPIDWMPDGENGLYGSYNEILVLNRLERAISKNAIFVSGLSMTSDYYLSPDARWMVLSIGTANPYASDLALIETTTRATSKINIGLDTCFKTPIGWTTSSKFLFRCDISTGATSKKIITEIRYYTYDVLKNELLEVSSGMDVGFGSISPNGRYVVRYENQNGYYLNSYVKDLSNSQFQSSKLPEGQIAWSHDSGKLAIFTNQGDLIIANYDGSNQEKIFSSGRPSGALIPMQWFPDDKYIALIGSSNNNPLATQLIILSTKGDIIKYDPIPVPPTESYDVIVDLSPLPAIKR